ncbi:MAG TPA: hypothetical protein PLO07_13955 [Rubrivivax sp.]|nr:hypothetical protein [Rubrivivax sp.]
MIDTSAFTKLMPGFDFLNTFMQGASQATPAMGQWVAPTLNPDDLEKRISELKTLHFWLEQNARMIGMTLQALEVQRMTLSTLKAMNLPLGDLRSALSMPEVQASAAGAPAAAAAANAAGSQPEPLAASFTRAFADAAAQATAAASAPPGAAAPGADAAAKPAVDAMQWWDALTQQFSELAAKAVQDGREIAERQLEAAKAATEAATAATAAATAATDTADAAATPKAAGAKPAAKPTAASAAKAARKGA